MSAIQQVAVVGAGLMGHGLALVFARAGLNVVVQDPDTSALSTLHERVKASLKALSVADIEPILDRIRTEPGLAKAVSDADFVVEAAPEKLELKKALFADIEKAAPAHCLFASNTSVIPITHIMEGIENRDRAVGTHWWNPPHIIPLVEVVRTEWTSDDTMDRVMAVLEFSGKSPVRVEKDIPGFIGNRLQHALWREAISLVEKGVCTARDVDNVVKESFGRRLAVLGPLENADLVGTELTQDIHNQVLHDLDNSSSASPYLSKLINNGKLGMKSGEGFMQWTEETAKTTRDGVVEHLLELEKILKR